MMNDGQHKKNTKKCRKFALKSSKNFYLRDKVKNAVPIILLLRKLERDGEYQ